MPVDFDPLEVRLDPYPVYRQLRDEAPVHWCERSQIWTVTRYADVLSAIKQPDVFSSRAMFTMVMNNGYKGAPPLSFRLLSFVARMWWGTGMNPLEFANARNLIAEDGESHTGMRNIVNRGFTPRRIASWEPRVREIVEQCLADVRTRDRYDLVERVSVPVPVTVIAEMLGVENERLDDFKRWSDSIIYNATGPGRNDPFNPEMRETMIGILTYIKRLAQERRKAPQDDLISVIVAEQEGEVGLSVREVVQFVVLLLVAGNETTTNLIGNTVSALLEHPEALDELVKDPSLVPATLEEALRYDAPVQQVFRLTTADTEIAGTRIPKDAHVALVLGSANRDERQFADPDAFQIGRNAKSHFGFGFGKHFCLGASLARLEAKAALEGLLQELPRVRRSSTPREVHDSFLVRGPKRLELERAA